MTFYLWGGQNFCHTDVAPEAETGPTHRSPAVPATPSQAPTEPVVLDMAAHLGSTQDTQVPGQPLLDKQTVHKHPGWSLRSGRDGHHFLPLGRKRETSVSWRHSCKPTA